MIPVISRCQEINYETDIVVLVYNLNDICWLSPETKTIYEKIFAFEQNLTYLERESYFINALSFRLKAWRDPNIGNYYDFVKSSYQGQAWEKQKRQLQEISQHLQEHDIEFLAVTFPFLHDLEQYSFANVHRQLSGFWRSEGVPYLDLLPLFRQHQSQPLVVNQFDAHPNELAHRLAAERIGEFLRREIKD